jgi:hypothetical protein
MAAEIKIRDKDLISIIVFVDEIHRQGKRLQKSNNLFSLSVLNGTLNFNLIYGGN